MKITTKKMIEVQDWDDVVKETYGKPYSFQQQDGCRSRGVFRFTVPDEADDFENETVLERVNGPDEGVKFSSWLARDPKTPLSEDESGWGLTLWWDRNFYPNVQMIANDLHAKGLLEAGDYTINIDW